MNELYAFIKEHEDKGFYFRGESCNYGEKSCLPSCLRNSKSSISTFDKENVWFQQKLEDLEVGLPYSPCKGDSTFDNITSALLNTLEWRFRIWDWSDEKLEALMTHYTPDFNDLNNASKGLLRETDFERCGYSFLSTFLDITPDIFVALHFTCSEHRFVPIDEVVQFSGEKKGDDGFLFVFDLNEIEKAEYLKRIAYPGYSYFCIKGDGKYYQSFDRIKHQNGSFLGPKRDNNKPIDYIKMEK